MIVLSAVFVLIVACTSINCNLIRDHSMGDTFGEPRYEILFEKNGVPLFTRCSDFTYPSDFVSAPHIVERWFRLLYSWCLFQAKPIPQAIVVPALRGFAHVNLIDKKDSSCGEPDVKVISGGIHDIHMKIEVCSKRGCPLQSKLLFYARNWLTLIQTINIKKNSVISDFGLLYHSWPGSLNGDKVNFFKHWICWDLFCCQIYAQNAPSVLVITLKKKIEAINAFLSLRKKEEKTL